MIALVILIPVVCWLLAGLLANQKANKIGEGKNPLVAALQGGVWVQKVLSMPEQPSKAPLLLHAGSEDTPSLVKNVTVPTESKEDELLALNLDAELEPFDSLPKRPRIGAVKTVCPFCRKKTKHDREGKCLKCKNLNTHLRRRWEIAQEGEELHINNTDVYQKQLQEAEERQKQRMAEQLDSEAKNKEEAAEIERLRQIATEQEAHVGENHPHCPNCHHRLFLDYYNRCVFCGEKIEEVEHE